MTIDGVLTIAEDVLSNHGRKFIEMMERLADLRFKKEEEAKREVAEAGGPYEDDYDDDDEENGYYEGEDGEDSDEEAVIKMKGKLALILGSRACEEEKNGRRSSHVSHLCRSNV